MAVDSVYCPINAEIVCPFRQQTVELYTPDPTVDQCFDGILETDFDAKHDGPKMLMVLSEHAIMAATHGCDGPVEATCPVAGRVTLAQESRGFRRVFNQIRHK